MKPKPTTLKEDIQMAKKLFRPMWDGGYINATYRDLEIVVAMIEKLADEHDVTLTPLNSMTRDALRDVARRRGVRRGRNRADTISNLREAHLQ